MLKIFNFRGVSLLLNLKRVILDPEDKMKVKVVL
uniref:Uncharacterized protein n=1 Tax=Anguilla anguilla TaxID=7936 RepID=A0A0E9XU52_ANGAN